VRGLVTWFVTVVTGYRWFTLPVRCPRLLYLLLPTATFPCCVVIYFIAVTTLFCARPVYVCGLRYRLLPFYTGLPHTGLRFAWFLHTAFVLPVSDVTASSFTTRAVTHVALLPVGYARCTLPLPRLPAHRCYFALHTHVRYLVRCVTVAYVLFYTLRLRVRYTTPLRLLTPR